MELESIGRDFSGLMAKIALAGGRDKSYRPAVQENNKVIGATSAWRHAFCLAGRLRRRTCRTDWSAVLVHPYSRTKNVWAHLCKRLYGSLIGLPHKWPPGSIAVDTRPIGVWPIWSEEWWRKGASDFTSCRIVWLRGSLVWLLVCSPRVSAPSRT